MMRPLNFLLAGVGGQGTILASSILTQVGLAAGYDVKQAEVHGMSQRGGSVTSYVRWGETVHAPLVGAGEVDVLVAFEKLEALRALPQLRQDALAVINMEAIIPVTVSSLGKPYPDDETLRAAVGRTTTHAVYVDGPRIASSLHAPRVENTALLGALSLLLQDHDAAGRELPLELWLDVIARRVPHHAVSANRAAFLAGRDAVLTPA
jgi:indolepyruvate ferredoxin oxidoreductase beta subunit